MNGIGVGRRQEETDERKLENFFCKIKIKQRLLVHV